LALQDLGKANNDTGTKGLQLVKDKFSWEKIAADFYSVYKWMLGGGSPPESVLRNL